MNIRFFCSKVEVGGNPASTWRLYRTVYCRCIVYVRHHPCDDRCHQENYVSSPSFLLSNPFQTFFSQAENISRLHHHCELRIQQLQSGPDGSFVEFLLRIYREYGKAGSAAAALRGNNKWLNGLLQVTVNRQTEKLDIVQISR